jgi:ankyrin repeat protein
MTEFLDAVTGGDVNRVHQLLDQAPGLVSARSESGVSAVLLAVYYGKPDVARTLVSRGARLDVFDASALGDLERVQSLVEADPGLANAYAPDGFQPLGLASFFGHKRVVKFLLAQGAEVNSPSRNAQRVMPLHSAVANRHLDIARLLVEHGADVNARQAQDFTPLHAAADNGQLDMVALLLAHGADPAARMALGKTPADFARERGHTAVAEALEAAA